MKALLSGMGFWSGLSLGMVLGWAIRVLLDR